MLNLFHMYHLNYSLSYVARLYISTIDREILGLGETYQCMQIFSTTFNHPWSQLIA